jgi:chorismate mutase/prephenate dehydratase
MDLTDLRSKIDGLDERLLDLLNERSRLVIDIGKAKIAADGDIYAPHRERSVIDRLIDRNPGPLPNGALESILREIMSGSLALEQPLTIGYLAPAGSFSHVAAVVHFGSSVGHVPLPSIEDVFAAVANGTCTHGLVPYENSTSGSVTETLDAFGDHDVTACAEALVKIQHCLIGSSAIHDITRVLSKREVLHQCQKWLEEHLPGVTTEATRSSSHAVSMASKDPTIAAIGSTLAAQQYDIPIIHDGIEDNHDNVTRFLVIGRQEAAATGTDKTAITFVTADKPGALVDVLAVFRDAGVNLTHIEKRPSGMQSWQYTFFADCMGHCSEDPLTSALAAAAEHCLRFRVLGSFPAAKQAL